MARVQAPLMSERASGAVFGVLSAEARASRAYIYEKKSGGGLQKGPDAGYGRNRSGRTVFGYVGRISARTLSAFQGARRAAFSEGRRQYADLSPTEKASLDAAAKPLRLTGALLWMRQFMDALGLS